MKSLIKFFFLELYLHSNPVTVLKKSILYQIQYAPYYIIFYQIFIVEFNLSKFLFFYIGRYLKPQYIKHFRFLLISVSKFNSVLFMFKTQFVYFVHSCKLQIKYIFYKIPFKTCIF